MNNHFDEDNKNINNNRYINNTNTINSIQNSMNNSYDNNN